MWGEVPRVSYQRWHGPAKIGATFINNCKCENLLGVNIDNKLSLDELIRSICRRKVNCFKQSCSVHVSWKMRLIMNAFYSTQFSYCSLTWVLHIRFLNHKINRLYERCLRVVYNDYHSSYVLLQNKDSYFSKLYFIDPCNKHAGGTTNILNQVFPLNLGLSYTI